MAPDSTTVPSLWGTAWATESGDNASWQDALSQAADTIAHHLDLIHRILASARSEGGFPEDVRSNAAVNALELGVVIGFAMAQTYPGTIQELADWPARALERAELDGWRSYAELPPARPRLEAVEAGEEGAH